MKQYVTKLSLSVLLCFDGDKAITMGEVYILKIISIKNISSYVMYINGLLIYFI